MKKIMTALVCMMLCLTMGAATAEEALEMEGVIEPSRTLTILAPYSGRTGDFALAAGDVLSAGEALMSLSTTRIYADFDGQVTGVFAMPGDAAASVAQRFGALLYMEREELYTAVCTTAGAANKNENKIVHVGETVYVQSTSDVKRDGVAIVTGVSDKTYTLDVLISDGIRLNDAVKVFRDSDYDAGSCIGTGKISRIDPVPVTAQGYVLAVHVKDGQTVSRGELLLEIVHDPLEAMQGGDGFVRMPQDGVLLSVNVGPAQTVARDQALATWCPAGEVQLRCSVDEEELALLSEGDRMTVTLEALGGEERDAVVTKIAAAADENGEFVVTLALDKTDGIRIGMSATAEK